MAITGRKRLHLFGSDEGSSTPFGAWSFRATLAPPLEGYLPPRGALPLGFWVPREGAEDVSLVGAGVAGGDASSSKERSGQARWKQRRRTIEDGKGVVCRHRRHAGRGSTLAGDVLPPLGPRSASAAGVLVLYSSSHAYNPFHAPLVSSTLMPQVRRIPLAAHLAHVF